MSTERRDIAAEVTTSNSEEANGSISFNHAAYVEAFSESYPDPSAFPSHVEVPRNNDPHSPDYFFPPVEEAPSKPLRFNGQLPGIERPGQTK